MDKSKKITPSEARMEFEKKNEAYSLIKSGLCNIEIAEIMGITYSEVLAYRISYERRCNNGK